jgi:hypothetical protein
VAGLDDRTVDAVAASDHRGLPNPLLAAYRAEALRVTCGSIAPGTPAAALLPPATAVIDLSLAGTLNVNEPSDIERAADELRRSPDERS